MRDIVCIALYLHCVLLLFFPCLDQCRVLVRFACVRREKRYMIWKLSTGHVALVTLHDTRLLPVALFPSREVFSCDLVSTEMVPRGERQR